MINVYAVTPHQSFEQAFLRMREDLYNQTPVDVGEWQSQKIEMKMLEMLHVVMEMPMPESAEVAAALTGARMPWAEDHFEERVSGRPMNPSPSEAWWPFRQKKDGDTNTDHKSEGNAFSHTYPERMWPKMANGGQPEASIHHGRFLDWEFKSHKGIRFEYGDLRDIVNQLIKHPLTRQAYLPIWFPEDTGAVHGKRVPCTLGYHFIIRDGKLDISYFMRSTDLLRHFQDDVYMAIRLAQWVAREINAYWEYKYNEPQEYPLEVGTLVFHTANLHIFEGDRALIDFWKTQGRSWF